MTNQPNTNRSDGGGGPVTKQRTATADSVVTREVDGEEQDMLRVPISSTRPDRENDEFDRDALEAMADQIRAENPMVFDNHGITGGFMDAIPYDARETIGAQMDAEVETAEDSESDLYALVNPDGTHPEGERMIKQVREEGQPIKFSVGFQIQNSDEKTDDAGNEIGRIFTSADLMETSRVGIPANPDASVTQSMAAKGGGGESLPGYANHPVMQMFAAMQGGGQSPNGVATKQAASDGGTKDDPEEGKPKCESDADCPDGEVCEDGHCVEASEASADAPELSRSLLDDPEAFEKAVGVYGAKAVHDAVAKEEGDPCDDNGDCGEGMVCVDGECVPEDDVDDDDDDDDDDEEDSAEPSELREMLREERERNDKLAEEVEEIREQIGERGDSETGDTDMSDTPSPDETDDATEPDDDSAGNGLLID
jgi:HK97 family phage prohead protease